MSRSRIATLAMAVAMAGSAVLQAQEAKRRVAVFPFEYATVREWVVDMWHSDVDIGKGVADMIVTDLVRNGTYSVVERSQLDRILGEQNFQQSGRADASTAAQIGKILGVDAIIIGSITEFGREDKRLGVAGNVRVGGIGIGRVGRNTSKAVVAINARIVSIQTAEILAVAEAKATSSRSGASIAGDAAGVTNVDFGSSSFGGTIIGEATRETVNQLVPQLVAAASKISETRVAVAGLVADVSGSEVILNIGTGAGVRVGGEYDVVRPGREVRDPASGRVIRRMTAPVGKVKITSADGESAVGVMTGGPARVGDCVGSCPASTPSAPSGGGAQAPVRPQQSSASVSGGGAVVALPALYTAPIRGAFSWAMYSFKGSEHLRYDVTSRDGGENKTGFYQFDASPAGQGRSRLRIEGRLGDDAFSSATTIAPNEGIPMMQMAQLGPAAIALFFPAYGMLFMGHEWEVGSFWSTSQGGETTSFKVESTCQYAGVQGLRGVWRKNDQVLIDLCVSPHIGFPLAVTFNDDDGETSYVLKLTEFRP